MKTAFKNSLLLFVLVLGTGSELMVRAQTFTVLHSFNGSDGDDAAAGLTISSNVIYGVTIGGGGWNDGTVYKLNTDGTGFTTLHVFDGSDGNAPNCRLVLAGNTLYGTTFQIPTVFALNTDGTGFTNLHRFDWSDGNYPFAGLVLGGTTLYGTTYYASTYNNGTVFSLNLDGTGFTTLYSFDGTNGANPYAGLVLSGQNLFGVTEEGGTFRSGVVFSMSTNGAQFTVLHNFSARGFPLATNQDGATPKGDLIVSGSTLYGTAAEGGEWTDGTVFSLKLDGSGFENLHSFSGTNSDGNFPATGLIQSGNTLYGATSDGGNSASGTIFALATDGTGFKTLHSFAAAYPSSASFPTNSDGNQPWGRLVFSGNKLYGTTTRGGPSGQGTIFSISFSPQLQVVRSETNLVLSWPTNYAGFEYTGFNLQSATNLAFPVWTTNSPPPVVINGQYTVTNPISSIQQFFKLSQ